MHHQVIAITLLGCACPAREPPAPSVQVSALPAITIKASSSLLYTYYASGEGFRTAGKLADVPQGQRGWVRVVDLTARPEQRKDHELVYVADLRSAKTDGSYPYVVMSRVAFEAAAQNRTRLGLGDPAPAGKGPPGTKGGGHGQVILYATSWCGACRSAREFFRTKGVSFIDKDIEKDGAAAAELMAKAKAAGISPSGVPVIDVRGTLVQGFDAQRLTALLGETT